MLRRWRGQPQVWDARLGPGEQSDRGDRKLLRTRSCVEELWQVVAKPAFAGAGRRTFAPSGLG